MRTLGDIIEFSKLHRSMNIRLAQSIFIGPIATLFLIGAPLAQTLSDGMDCLNAPKDAVTVLPGNVGEWGRIECGPDTHRIVAKDGWLVRNTRSMKPDFVSAGDERKVHRDIYFFSLITYEPMSDKEKDQIIRQFPDWAVPKRLKERADYFVLTIETNGGSRFRYSVVTPGGGIIWLHNLNKLPRGDAIAVVNKSAFKEEIEKIKQKLR